MKNLRVYTGLFVALVTVISISVFSGGIPTSAVKQEVNKNTATSSSLTKESPASNSTTYSGEPLSKQIEKLSPEEKALVKDAKKHFGIHKNPDGTYILLEVDGIKIHDNPEKEAVLRAYKRSQPEDTLDTLPEDTELIEVID